MTRFSRRTSLLSAILILSMGAATAQDVPKHLQLAREFLANTHPEDNLYVDKGNMYVKAPSDIFSSKYVVHTDCKGFIAEMVSRTYGYTPNFTTRQFKNAYSITDWLDGAVRGEVFSIVPSVADVKPGDVIMWKYLVPPKYAPTHRGHIMIVNEAPVRMETSRLEGAVQWKVRVVDSSGAHSRDDTRYVPGMSADKAGDTSTGDQKRSGVGEGTIFLYTNEPGNILAASHGFSKSTINMQNDTWFTIAARLNKG